MFGDWNLALAAYNAGEGRISRGIDRQGVEDYWELRETRALARETKNYVPMIHAAIVVAKAPEKYGFEITPEAPIPFDTVPVDARRGPARDRRVRGGGAWTTSSSLNPELRRLATPADRTFPLKVPSGARDHGRELPGGPAAGEARHLPDPHGRARPDARRASRGATAPGPRRSPTRTACASGKRLARGPS